MVEESSLDNPLFCKRSKRRRKFDRKKFQPSNVDFSLISTLVFMNWGWNESISLGQVSHDHETDVEADS